MDKYCNWSFNACLKTSRKWLVKRDCEDNSIELSRGDSRHWKAYKASLQPQVQQRYPYPIPGAQCPNCGKQVNGVNPFDDGETWRK
jgi:hypothetical protein